MQGISNTAGFIPLLPSLRSGMNDKASAAAYGFEPPAAPTVLAQLAARNAASLSLGSMLDSQTVQTLMQMQETSVAPRPSPTEEERVKERESRRRKALEFLESAAKEAEQLIEPLHDESDEDADGEEQPGAKKREIPIPRNFVKARKR